MSIRMLLISLLLAGPAAALEIGDRHARGRRQDARRRRPSAVDGRRSPASRARWWSSPATIARGPRPGRRASRRSATRTPERGVGVIAINANDPSAHKEDGYDAMVERAKLLGLEFPYVVDAKSRVAARLRRRAHARGVPLRCQRQAGLPRHHRRQRRAGRRGQGALPARRPRGGGHRRAGAGRADQGAGLHDQVLRELTLGENDVSIVCASTTAATQIPRATSAITRIRILASLTRAFVARSPN